MLENYSKKVEGMTCGNCALTISKLLEKKGMQNISANAASGEVNFAAPPETDISAVYDDIDSLGYHVVREEDQAQHGHVHSSFRNETALLIICAFLTFPLLMHMFSSWHVLHHPWVQFALATPVFIIGLYTFLPGAWRSLLHRMPNMNVLILLGAGAAYFYSLTGLLFFAEQAHEYLFFETTASIITLVMTGNWLEHKTVKSTTAAIDELVKLQPQYAIIILRDSLGKESLQKIESKYVRAGDWVMVNTGDAIPVDGLVLSGNGNVDEKMLTGESIAVPKTVGDKVIGGTVLSDGNLKMKATEVGRSSVLSHIIRLVRDAQATKPPLQKLADKISAIFVPVVAGIALLTFLVNYFWVVDDFTEAMMRSIAVLVISCPCAMGLATPAAIAVGLGRAAKNGILIKGGDTLEKMKTIRQIVFDKTGTLTTGDIRVSEVHIEGIEEAVFKNTIVNIEKHSSHPIAKSISQQWKETENIDFTKLEELKGKGMLAVDEAGNEWKLGSLKWLHTLKEKEHPFDLYLYKNGVYAGAFNITDTLRPDAKSTIEKLHGYGYTTILLSGDRKEKCERIALELGIQKVFSEHSPEQKNKKLEELMQIAPTAMVGDGINDAPALAKATVGISLSDASQIAIQTASVILSNNQLSTLPKAIRLGIFTEQTIRQNLFWAFFYNIIAIPVAAVGLLKPTFGAGIMALSDVVLILNSLRLGLRKIDN